MAAPTKPVRLKNALFEDVELIFRNFAGEARKFNPEGQRNFGIKISHEIAEQMVKDGWTCVKYLRPQEEGELPQPWVKVKIRYGSNRPPKAFLKSSRGKTPLGENEIAMLDFTYNKTVDVIINPYTRTSDDDVTTTTAYLASIVVTIEEDALDLKYADVPDVLTKQEEADYFSSEPPF